MAGAEIYDAFWGKLQGSWTATAIAEEGSFSQQVVEAGLPFVFMELFDLSYGQISTGAQQQNYWEEHGITKFHVMTRSGQGSRQARVHADALRQLFREQPLDTASGAKVHILDLPIGPDEPGQDFPNYFSIALVVAWKRIDATDLT
jgi:hypothetical protein